MRLGGGGEPDFILKSTKMLENGHNCWEVCCGIIRLDGFLYLNLHSVGMVANLIWLMSPAVSGWPGMRNVVDFRTDGGCRKTGAF